MSKLKILVVDDQPIVRQGTALTVATMGLEVDQAASGAEALVMLKAAQYAAIIMDYNMPEMNGFECVAKIREMENDTGTRIPIICMTASTETNIGEACINAGLDDYLDKDCKGDELRFAVLKWVNVTDKSGEVPQKE